MKLRRMLRRKLLFWAAVAALTLLAAVYQEYICLQSVPGESRGLFCLPKGRLMLFPLSRLRRQLSQRESQD